MIGLNRPVRPLIAARIGGSLIVSAALAVALPGCGSGSPSTDKSSGQTSSARSSQSGAKDDGRTQRRAANEEAGRPAGAPSGVNSLVRTDADGRQWIDDVPLDVWFDDPLGVYQNNQQVAAAPLPAPAIGDSNTTLVPATDGDTSAAVAGTTDPPAAGSGVNWSEVVPAAALEAETKLLANRLTSAMNTVGTFNGNLKQIQWDGATLCAIGGIAGRHSGELRWKGKAHYVRELGMQIEEGAQDLGRKGYDQTQPPFEHLIVVLSGGEASGVDEPEPTAPFGESASRGGVMRRMQEAFDFLSKSINTEDKLKIAESRDKALHEASLLAALSQVISDASYDSADEEEYAGHAHGLVEDAAVAAAAARSENYETFRSAVDRMSNRCNMCHATYRFE